MKELCFNREMSTTRSDIPIPNEFSDVCKVMRDNKVKDYISYIFSESVFPFDYEIGKLIKPKSQIPDKIDESFQKFIELYKEKSDLFLDMPIFSIMFASKILSHLSPKEIPMKFIRTYLEDLRNHNRPTDENILDFLIPFPIYKQFIQDNPPTIQPFFAFLCQFFGPSVFLNHFLKTFAILVQDKIPTKFHIELMDSIYSQFNFSKEESDEIQRVIIDPLLKTDSYSNELACRNLQTHIRCKFSPHSSLKNLNSSTDPFDQLNQYLDFIENSPSEIEFSLFVDIRSELFRLNQFPERSPKPLMNAAVPFYSTIEDEDDDGTSQKQLRSLVFKLNLLCNNKDMYKCYRYLNENIEQLNIDADFLEKCYQNFLKHCRNRNQYPERLVRPEKPIRVEQPIEVKPKNPLDEKIKEGFDLLAKVETAYEGAQLLWELIVDEYAVNQIELYINEIEYRPRVYLAYGLRALENESPRSQEINEIIEHFEEEILG